MNFWITNVNDGEDGAVTIMTVTVVSAIMEEVRLILQEPAGNCKVEILRHSTNIGELVSVS